MSTDDATKDAVEVLQQLGLKKYEATCFVGLSKLSGGTAKQLSEATGVPRTRAYDAIRVLEARGLVEVQRTTPQRFRAVPVPEAVEVIRDRYESRVERLRAALEDIERTRPEVEHGVREVRTVSGREAVTDQIHELIEGATDEVVFVLWDESFATDELLTRLNGADIEGDLLVATANAALSDLVRAEVPAAETVVSRLDWLEAERRTEDEPRIGRLLIVDRTKILVSTLEGEAEAEHAIMARGTDDGLVAVVHRLLTQRPVATPETTGK